MYIPKRYGQSQISVCPFCEKRAIVMNQQGVPVCASHKNLELGEMKCICGEVLDLREGKWGPYFFCMRCGNVNFRKGLEYNPQKSGEATKQEPAQKKHHTPSEITVRGDELDLM